MMIWFLLAALTLQLTGCSSASEDELLGTTFFYVRSTYQYNSEENVIAGENRSTGPGASTIIQLVGSYLSGPVTEGLVSPFPEDIQILGIQDHSGLLEMTLSNMDHDLSDAQFSLACVCLGKTLLTNTDIIQVTFFSGDRSITVTRDNYLTTDEVGATEMTKEVTS